MELPEGLAGLLLRAVQQDSAAVDAIFANRSVKTLAAVAKEFGVELSTVKDWRKQDMPGSPGNFPIGAIYLWKLKRVISAPQFTGASTGSGQNDLDRKRAADARKAEADAVQKEQANELRAGNLLYRDVVEREMAGVIIAARESFLRLPREMTPRFPRGVAIELTEELKMLIEGKLKVLGKRRMLWEESINRAIVEEPAAAAEEKPE